MCVKMEELEKHVLVRYEWLDSKKPSRIRMMLQWQGAGGLPYVASVHHRATQCFRYEGNSRHKPDTQHKSITAVEWQQAVKERHRAGSTGMEGDASAGKGSEDIDFKGIAQ